MKTYCVTIRKVVEQDILVLANSEGNAIMAVRGGEGSLEGPPRYIKTLDPESWFVQQTNPDGSFIEEENMKETAWMFCQECKKFDKDGTGLCSGRPFDFTVEDDVKFMDECGYEFDEKKMKG